MPKKIIHECAVHQLLGSGLRLQQRITDPGQATTFAAWLAALSFEHTGPDTLRVSWASPIPGFHDLALRGARLYMRGDTDAYAERQMAAGLPFAGDGVMEANRTFFDGALHEMLVSAKALEPASLCALFSHQACSAVSEHERKEAEEVFHNEWADSEDLSKINVRQRNEACTAPEMRHIRQTLGDLHGKTLLDVGCGLGEASVYFAMEGADVTATDISAHMCEAAQRLAAANGVTLETHVSAVEDLGLGTRQFDIIYAGNLLHHADICKTLDNLVPHLKPDGTFVSWDPLAYNPVINLYRAVATRVRTQDEHPLRLRDVREVTSRFAHADVSWSWLCTQLLFILMFAVQFRNPNRERFWKKVIDEEKDWAWLYRPLAALDRALLALLPFLRPLCWNVVVIARNPRKERGGSAEHRHVRNGRMVR